MCPSICNSFPVIRTASAKNSRFRVPQPTFLFPLETPLRLLPYISHGWKESWMVAKPLAACTYLSWILSWVIRCLSKCVSAKITIFTTFLFPWGDALVVITLNVIWMESEFDAYKLPRCMCLSNYNRFWNICEIDKTWRTVSVIATCINWQLWHENKRIAASKHTELYCRGTDWMQQSVD